MKKVASALVEMKRSKLTLAVGKNAIKDLDTLAAIVTNLSNWSCPAGSDIKKYSDFFVQVLAKCANWCSCKVNSMVKVGTKRKAQVNTFYGKEAADANYKLAQKSFVEDKTNDMHTLEPLKMFKWLLEPAQQEAVDAWQKLGIKQRRASLSQKMLGNGAPSEAAGPVSGACCAEEKSPGTAPSVPSDPFSDSRGASSSASSAAPLPSKSLDPAKAQLMMSLFGKKAMASKGSAFA